MKAENSTNRVRTLLFDPILTGANRLCILSANASPNMASWLLTTYAEEKIHDVSVELIVESVLDHGIDNASHERFKDLHDNKRFSCSYLYKKPDCPIPKTNLYIWLHDEEPVKAFNCSSDFTQPSLLDKRSGSLNDRAAAPAYKTFEQFVECSVYCNYAEVEEYVDILPPGVVSLKSIPSAAENCVHLSLLTRKGETGRKSGLNWGQRKNRNPNEAYILLPRKVARTGFFPLEKKHFLVITDDHHTLQLRVEQQGDKAITTPESNAQLGEYFRNRLGLPNGAFVETSDLKAYGRTEVTFYKIDDEQYYMDFSRPEEKG